MLYKPISKDKIEIWAHRGAGLITEEVHDIERNTLESFKFSRELHIDGFETDLDLTEDKEPIIYHRGTFPSAEPTNMSWRKAKSTYGQLVHLKDLLNFLQSCPLKFRCLLEIKQNSSPMVNFVSHLIEEKSMTDKIILTVPRNTLLARIFVGLSVDGKILSFEKEFCNPKIRIHLIDTWPSNIIKQAQQIKADIVSFGWLNDSLASKAVFHGYFKHKMARQCQEAQRLNIKAFGGITETEDQIETLLEASGGYLNGIVTDDPEGALKFLRS